MSRNHYENFFTRWGSPAESSDVSIRIYLRRPDCIDEREDVARYDQMAADQIEELQEYIETLKKIRTDYQKRYMYLATATTTTAIRIRRRKDSYENKVYYYLEEVSRRIDDGKEVVTTINKYPGAERHTAFADFEAYKKAHPGIEAIKDTEKGRWER